MTSAMNETTTRAPAAEQTRGKAVGHLGRKLIAVLVSFALAGCQTMPTMSGANAASTNRTPDEARMDQQAQAFNRTVAEGCVVGAALGALAGALIAGGNNRGKGILIGTAAGAAIGCGSGVWIAKAQQQNALTEQQLDGMTTEVRNKNAQVSSYVSSAKSVIAADKARIARIDKDLTAGRISMDQARTEMSEVDRNRRDIEQTIANVRAERANYEKALQAARSQSNQSSVQQADTEVARLEKQVSALESDLDKLIKRRQLSRVG